MIISYIIYLPIYICALCFSPQYKTNESKHEKTNKQILHVYITVHGVTVAAFPCVTTPRVDLTAVDSTKQKRERKGKKQSTIHGALVNEFPLLPRDEPTVNRQ